MCTPAAHALTCALTSIPAARSTPTTRKPLGDGDGVAARAAAEVEHGGARRQPEHLEVEGRLLPPGLRVLLLVVGRRGGGDIVAPVTPVHAEEILPLHEQRSS